MQIVSGLRAASPRSAFMRYGIAVAAVVVAVAFRLALDPSLSWKAPFVFFTLAILLSARVSGLGPGLAATGLSILAGEYFFVRPHGTFRVADAGDLFNMALFGVVGIAISLICGRLRGTLAKSLREEERLRLISDTTPEIIWTANADGVFDFLNARWFEYSGADAATQTEGWTGFLHPEDFRETQAFWKELGTAQADWRREFRLRRRDGIYHWFETRAVAQRDADGRVEKWFGSSTDVQEARELREKARAEDERRAELEVRLWRTLVERAPMGIVMLDRSLRHVQASQRWLDEVGLTREEMLAKDHYECLPTLPERWREAHQKGLAGEMLSGREESFIAPSGERRWVNWQIVPWGDTGERTGGIVVYSEDITERKRLAAVAERREFEYRSLFENMSDGLAYCQMIFEGGKAQDYIYVYVNGAFGALTGFRNVEGRRMSELLPSGLRIEPEIVDLYGRVAMTGIPEKTESYIKRMDQWLSISAYSPELGYFVVIFNIITKRKKEELAARQWERAFAQSASGLSLTNPATDTIVAVNSVAARMLGYGDEDLAGRAIEEFYPKSELAHRAMELRSADSESGHVLFESKLLRKDGSEFPALLDVTAVKDESGKVISRVTVIHDLTESKRAALALRESEETMRALLDSAGQAILAVNEGGKIVLRNSMAGIMFGYGPEELIGQPVDMLVPDDAKGRHAEHHATYFANPEVRPMARGRELTGLRKDGTFFPVEISLSFVETTSGKLGVAFVSDISVRKQMEKAAQVRAGQVSALAASLLTVQEDERRRVSRELHDRICQQLASLAIDIGGLVASQQASSQVQSQLREFQTRVVTASEETRHIAYELHSSVLDDLGLLASLRDLCRQFRVRVKGIDVEFSGAPLNIAVPREVASCVYRIAQESLQNVAKHANAENVSVDLALHNGTIVLTVADDGDGFDQQEVRGRGRLGLIGMEERVQLARGKLTVESQPGKGTRIELAVPLPSGLL